MILDPFRAEDLLAILYHTPEAGMWAQLSYDQIKALANGHSYTLRSPEGIVACGGLIPMWPGLAEGWLAVGPASVQHKYTLARTAVRFFRTKASELKLRRVQAHTVASFTKAWEWLERMGFKRESEMLKFGHNGETYYLYVWFPKHGV